MLNMRYAQVEDKEFWFGLDKHLSEKEFITKVRDRRGYIALENDEPIGLVY